MITKRAVLFDVDNTLSSGTELGNEIRTPLYSDTMRDVFNEVLSNPENTIVIYSRYTTVDQIKSFMPAELVNHERIIFIHSKDSRVDFLTDYLQTNNYESGIIVDDDQVKVKDKENIVHIQVPYINNGYGIEQIISDSYLKMTTLPMPTLFEIKDEIERQKELVKVEFDQQKIEAAENLNTLYHDTIVQHCVQAYMNVEIPSDKVLDILNDKSFRSTSKNPVRKMFSPDSSHAIASKELRALHRYLEKNETITLAKLVNGLRKFKSPLLEVLKESIYSSSINPECQDEKQAKSQAESQIMLIGQEFTKDNHSPSNQFS